MMAGIPPALYNSISYLPTAIIADIITANADLAPLTFVQKLILVLWNLHFVRRTLEAQLVHNFSKASTPFMDAAVEYLYYWGFTYWIYTSVMSPHYVEDSTLLVPGILIWLAGEAGNTYSHRKLATLRKAAKTSSEKEKYPIPRGFLFDLVSCPHYLCEATSWLGFALIARTYASWAFFVVGGAIMFTWAKERHARYLQIHPNYPKRNIMVPFVL
eukprot:TRINITY_DN10101_c0_g1_i2.p2 TRINITY_DN10101_c0_g1~~TRINITY_DN10101_c0_g1_i2.p2  ORF type:complete len:215 (-),score=22.34 TRINITY_DN10101_c0_g1_i2:65-709(-)